jgi:hypothetical protein
MGRTCIYPGAKGLGEARDAMPMQGGGAVVGVLPGDLLETN